MVAPLGKALRDTCEGILNEWKTEDAALTGFQPARALCRVRTTASGSGSGASERQRAAGHLPPLVPASRTGGAADARQVVGVVPGAVQGTLWLVWGVGLASILGLDVSGMWASLGWSGVLFGLAMQNYAAGTGSDRALRPRPPPLAASRAPEVGKLGRHWGG